MLLVFLVVAYQLTGVKAVTRVGAPRQQSFFMIMIGFWLWFKSLVPGALGSLRELALLRRKNRLDPSISNHHR